MWFGDSVTLTTWPDIWLHEGFATWSEWIWSEHQGNKSAAQWFKQLYNTPAQDTAFWTPPPGAPGTPAFMFNGTIYNRGAMTLEALREKIGDPDVLPADARLGHATPLRQRDHRPVHRPRRAATAGWTWTTSSTSGSTNPTSPPPGRRKIPETWGLACASVREVTRVSCTRTALAATTIDQWRSGGNSRSPGGCVSRWPGTRFSPVRSRSGRPSLGRAGRLWHAAATGSWSRRGRGSRITPCARRG